MSGEFANNSDKMRVSSSLGAGIQYLYGDERENLRVLIALIMTLGMT